MARPGTWLGFLSHPTLFFHNVLGLTKFIAAQKDKTILNDYFTWKRDHSRRYNLYQDVMEKQGLKDSAFDGNDSLKTNTELTLCNQFGFAKINTI